jgi:two-component system sensor histidine kinase/response regulator
MSLRVALLAGLLILSCATFAQKNEIDSLESLVKMVPSDTNKVFLLNRLVTALREKDNNKALTYAQQASDLAQLLGDKKGLSNAYENLGWILYRSGDYSKSIETSTNALKLAEELGDKQSIARCQVNIAAIYYEQKRYEHAIASFRQGYNTAEEIGDFVLMARCLNNVAFTFVGLQQFDSATFFVKKALKISEKSGAKNLVAFSYRTMGDIEMAQNNVRGALHEFEACYAIAKTIDNTFVTVSVLHRLGKCHATLGELDVALQFLKENIVIARKFGFRDELERSYKLLADIFFQKHDIDKAYFYQSAYVSLHDSLYNQRNSEQIALMQIRFDTEIKQAQIELLTKDAALQGEEIKQQRVWIYFYVGCLTLLLILAFVLFYNIQQTKKAKLILEEKNQAIQRQTQQLRNVNASKDKLFSIISHDLRSPLASLRALMEIASRAGLTQDEFHEVSLALSKNLDSVYEDLDNLLLWAQTQLKGMRSVPEKIEIQKLAAEKIELYKNAAEAKQITITNDLPPELLVFADRNHVSLILRNLIANAIKFNQRGGTIHISAEEDLAFCRIFVVDSGVGIRLDDIHKLFNAETHFTTPGTNKERGLGIGLLLTKEFVESNEGTISVSSELGKGTTFTFTLKTAVQEVLVS